ncbi:MAG: class I SAM-dependent methyltransferase [Patescibacteria group bacterium]
MKLFRKSNQKNEPVLYPLGHYYSPIPSREEIIKRSKKIFGIKEKKIDGVDLNETEQLVLLEQLKKYYDAIPFNDQASDDLRYYYKNEFYSYSDGIFLYGIIRHFKPKKIIEIGSGFSSAIMLDTNERFFQNQISCSFIDPYPERLLSILNKGDEEKHTIINDCVQDVDLDTFEQLEANDILFIDSSHVAKTGNDVNHIFFEILPKLNKGTIIHFHDVFFPFEYPKKWVLEGRGWNEDYLLRAFLQYNSKFKIILFATFLEHFYQKWFEENMPLCLKNRGGSIWLKKL